MNILELTDHEYAMVFALLGITTGDDANRLYDIMKRRVTEIESVGVIVKNQRTGDVIKWPMIRITKAP